MDGAEDDEDTQRSDRVTAVRAAVVRTVRERRGIGVSEAADAMGMPLRSYQHFEAGGGRLNVDLMLRFAEVMKSDRAALFIAIGFETPALAIQTLDNKLVSLLLLQLMNFNKRVGDQMARVPGASALAEFRLAFDRLEAIAKSNDPTDNLLSRTDRAPSDPEEED
jgi:hypothetical protein